jgi:hypothetical protein
MRIQETSVEDPDSLNINPDPAFQVIPDPDTYPDPIRIQGFDDRILRKKYHNKFRLIFLWTNDFRTYFQNKSACIKPISGTSIDKQSFPKEKNTRAETARIPPFSKLLSVFWIVWLMVFSISYYRE